jgi:hypothetical protein
MISKVIPLYAKITRQTLCASTPQWPPVGNDFLYFAGTSYQNDGGIGLRWPAAAEAEGAKEDFEWMDPPAPYDADLMAVPVRRLYQRGTLISPSAILAGRSWDDIAELNPQDAEHLGLREGKLVSASLSGRVCELTIHLNPKVPHGIALVPSHLCVGPLTLTLKAGAQVPE